jgi:hypothetical protein
MEIKMRIYIRGWSRDMGEKELVSATSEELKISDDKERWVFRDKPPTIFRDAPYSKYPTYYPRLHVAWHQKMQYMGDYRMAMELTRGDVLQLFKAMFGTELRAYMIEDEGFTVSEGLKNAVLKTVKLTDLTLGELAAMSAAQAVQEPQVQEKATESDTASATIVKH